MSALERVYEKTGNKVHTLTIIQSEFGSTFRVFGGYTDVPWRMFGGSEGIVQRGNSFLFSVRPNGSVVKIRCRKKYDEVYH